MVFLAGPAGAAIAWLGGAAGKRLGCEAASGKAAGGAAALGVVLLLALARVGVGAFDERIGTFEQVVPVVALLRERVAAGDRVAAYLPEDVVLRYALARDGRLSESLLESDRRARRVFVVVQKSAERGWAEQYRLALRAGRVDARAFDAPVVVGAFEEARVYQLDRRGG